MPTEAELLRIHPSPLQWPRHIGRRRRVDRKTSKFSKKVGHSSRPWTAAEARDAVLDELQRMKASHVTISTDLPVAVRGSFMREQNNTSDDAGAAVWFKDWRGRPYVIACDTYTRIACNLRAIASTLEALRSIERHGSSQLLERAFEGFTALPPAREAHGPWREILGMPPVREPWMDAADELALAERRYKEKRAKIHPDKPGVDAEDAVAVNIAIERAREELEPKGGT